MNKSQTIAATTAELRRRAEARLDARAGKPRANPSPNPEADTHRLYHELQVHQVELEMQNAELQEARDRMEVLLEKYTDLYDFAPVGYFSLDQQGRILEMNLTGAALLGAERFRLIDAQLPRFVAPASQSVFQAFLGRVFAGTEKQVCEASLLRTGAGAFWVSIHGVSALSDSDPTKWCRVAVSDITALKEAEEAERRMEAMAMANRELRREIVRRKTVEEALRKSEQHSLQLLAKSRRMQEELRLLSRQVLSAQEEERKRISRELHDVIAQTLASINVRLANLKKEATVDTKGLERNIALTQKLVQQAVDIVHQFALELRPTVLDDLGLIPALHTLLKTFKEQTGVHVRMTAFAAIEQVMGDKRTVLYRVAQEALANVGRHAKASQVDVKIQQLNGGIGMEIKDNGKGFLVEGLSKAKKSQRLGLLGMRERLEMVGGSFKVISILGKGTTVQAQIPLTPSPAEVG